MATTYSLDAYREQIRHYAQTMALGRNDAAGQGLAVGHTVARVGMFTEGNLYKRYEKLQNACELLQDGLEELADLVKQYIKEVPLSAYDTGNTDAERFLIWVEKHADLNDEQQDFVRCQRSRHAVEFVAMKQRLAHVRYQELLSMNEQLVGELDTNARLTIHINPVHVWSRFETKALLGDDDAAPATVLFYPIGNDIRTAVIEAECEQLIHLLEQHGVMRVKDLKKLFPAEEHGSLLALLKDLADMGMIALG